MTSNNWIERTASSLGKFTILLVLLLDGFFVPDISAGPAFTPYRPGGGSMITATPGGGGGGGGGGNNATNMPPNPGVDGTGKAVHRPPLNILGYLTATNDPRTNAIPKTIRRMNRNIYGRRNNGNYIRITGSNFGTVTTARANRTNLRLLIPTQPPMRPSSSINWRRLPYAGNAWPSNNRFPNWPHQRNAGPNNNYPVGRAGGATYGSLPPENSDAIKRGLNWLQYMQTKSGPRAGSWPATWGVDTSPVAATSLASLTYMYYPTALSTDLSYRVTLKDGLEYLLAQNKRLGGVKGDFRDGGQGYDQAVCVQALAEAYKTFDEDPKFLQASKDGIDFSIKSLMLPLGGWRYNNNNMGGMGDISVSAWAIRTLAICNHHGITTPDMDTAKNNSIMFLDKVSGGPIKEFYGYSSPGGSGSTTYNVLGLTSQMFLAFGWDELETARKSPRNLATWEAIENNLPNTSQVNYYQWYNGTYGTALMGEDSMKKWTGALTPILLSKQIQTNLPNGKIGGYWPPEGSHSSAYGRHYTTVFALLSLLVPSQFGKGGQYIPTNLR